MQQLYSLMRKASLLCVLLVSVACVNAQGYTNVASAQGLDFTVAVTSPADFGTGVSFRDFDGDGWDDLTFANVNDSLIVYRNNNGTLERMPSPAFAEGTTRAVLWADIDNDGDDDLLVTTFLGKVKLYRNLGGGQFEDITATAGFVPANGKRWGASFGDYDKDGFLDLYVCTYIYDVEPYGYSKLNHLYRNNGNGTFQDVTLQAGVGDGLKASFQSVWMDVDLDGWPDLYVINDFEPANSLFRNNGNGTFTNMTAEFGLEETGEHCMSISRCDFDLDGDLDIFMTNTGVFPQTNNARHMLMLNNGDGTYTESSTLYGLDIFDWGWGSLWVDHDNDGYQDLYIATHRELGPPERNLFFKNNAGESFSNGDLFFPEPQIVSSHSVARGDLDRDGYADIVVHNQHPFPPLLWKSDGGIASHVRVSLEGVISNRMAIGSWIKVYAGGQEYIHYTVCGENYLGQSSQHVLFGLNFAPVVDSIVVEYLSGHVDRYYDLPVNAEYSFVEGETLRPTIAANGPLTTCAPASVVLDAGLFASYLWSNGQTGRFLTVFVSGEYSVIVQNDFGVSATSEAVLVTIGSIPAIVVNEQDPLCAGEASGSISLVNLNGVATQSVVWGNGATGAQIQGLGAGVYSYTFLDVNGCSSTGVVELLDPDPLFVLVNSMNASAGSNGSISWTIFGGSAPYTVRVDGELVSGGTLAALGAGVYLVQVSDAQGCLFEQNVVILGSTGVTELEANDLQIYPNPTRDVLFVGSSKRFVVGEVFDARGRSVLQQGIGVGPMAIGVAALAPGLYTLELRSAEGDPQRTRFVKADR